MLLGRVLFREGHASDILFGIIHDGGKLRHFRPYLVGDVAPQGARRFRCILNKGVGDERGDDTSALFAACASTFLMK